MDLWVVAAATGVGYIAKYWQNLSLSGEKDGSSSEPLPGSSIQGQSEPLNLLHHTWDRAYPFRRLPHKQLGCGDVSSERDDVSDGRFREMDRLGCVPEAEIASTSGKDPNVFVNLDKYEDHNVLSLASPAPNFCGIGDGIGGKNEPSGNSGDVLPQIVADRLTKSKFLSRRMANKHFVKPLSSSESGLTAHFYRERDKTEECGLSSVGSPSTLAIRPSLLLTNESRIISGVDSDPSLIRCDGGEDGLPLEESNTLSRIQPFQRRGILELPRKQKQRSGNPRLSETGRPLHSQGSSDGMVLFFLGITMGIMSAAIANKREVDKLNNVLKQTENLVQDFHEELEMKDTLTVRQLADEGSKSRRTFENSSFNLNPLDLSFREEWGESTRYDSKDLDDQNVNPEVMSKIEAELEAELERLELNIKASISGKISDFVELDPGFEADVVQAELRLNTVDRNTDGSSDSDHDASGTSTGQAPSGYYAVSPWELSLRLHELIESRLEARIRELEAALQNSQKRVNVTNSEVGSSSTPDSTIFIDETRDRPSSISLSREAIRAYDEAYEDKIRIALTDQNTPDTLDDRNPPDTRLPQSENLFEDRSFNNEVSLFDRDGAEESWSSLLVRDKIRPWEEQTLRSHGSNEESEDVYEDELEQLLIKQIVEKTKRDSSLFLNARQMFSMFDDVEKIRKY